MKTDEDINAFLDSAYKDAVLADNRDMAQRLARSISAFNAPVEVDIGAVISALEKKDGQE